MLLDTVFNRESEIAMGVSYTLFSIIGTFGNLLTIIVMIKFRRLRNFCTPFLINLSICDAMMTSFILPILAFNGITGHSYIPVSFCKILSIIFHVIVAVSTCSLAAVSFVRCLAIWTDNKCRLLEHHKRCLTVIWTLPTLTLLIFYYHFWSDDRHIRASYVCSFFCGISSMQSYNLNLNKYSKQVEKLTFSNHSTSRLTKNMLDESKYVHDLTLLTEEEFELLEIPNYSQDVVYNSEQAYSTPTWMFVLPPSLFNYVPLGILVVSYCMIWVKIKRSNDRIEGMVAFNKHKNEVRFSQMIGMIFGSYLVCSTIPTIVAAFGSSSEFLPIGLSMESSSSMSSNIDMGSNNDSSIPMSSTSHITKTTAKPLLTFTYIIFFLQNVCNPLIYIVSNRAYRIAYYKLLCPKHNHSLDGVNLYRFSQNRDAFEMQSQYA